MRILAFYPYVPFPLDRGAHYRGYHLLRELARSHDVDLIALAENGREIEQLQVFREFCHRVEFLPFQHPPWQKLIPKRLLNPLPSTVAHWTLPHAAGALNRMLATECYDAVHVFDIVLAQYLLDERRQLPIVLDRTRVDLQYQLMEWRRMRAGFKGRLLNLENFLKLRRYERIVAKRTAFQVVCGPDDAQFLRQYIRPSLDIEVIPNGVDTAHFQPEAPPAQTRAADPTVLFCGAMDYNPNIDALRWYFGSVHPELTRLCPNLRLLIVGKEPVAEVKAYGTRPGVIVTGAVPDVRPCYREAWVQIVPLRIGGGTRLKIVESMAMGTPVISTPIGAQGLHLKHEHDILLADAAGDFARQAARALSDPALRVRLAANGRRTVKANLSWPRLGRQLCASYSRHFGSAP